MRCRCPHCTETANGWCCSEVMHLRDKLAECQEALKREKAKNRHRDRTGTEAEFGASDPSSRRVKANSEEEKQERRGGAVEGHPEHKRKGATAKTVDEVVRVETPEETCPECGAPLQDMGKRERTVDDLERPRVRKTLYRVARKWCPCCRPQHPPLLHPRREGAVRETRSRQDARHLRLHRAAMKKLAKRMEPSLERLRGSVRRRRGRPRRRAPLALRRPQRLRLGIHQSRHRPLRLPRHPLLGGG